MLEEKWRIVFSLLDVDKDGAITKKDADFCKGQFVDMCPDAERKLQVAHDLDRYWTAMVFFGEPVDWAQVVTMDQFVERFTEAFARDKAGTVARVADGVQHLLAAADIDGSGVFTFQKFFQFHQAFNLAHDIVVRTTFNLIGPDADDTCPLARVQEFYIELFVGENQEKFETLKNAYKAIGMI